MGTSKKGATLSVHTRNEIISSITERGAALTVKKGTYAALVLEWWYSQGCPAVTPADQAMQDMKVLQAAEGKATPPAKKKTA